MSAMFVFHRPTGMSYEANGQIEIHQEAEPEEECGAHFSETDFINPHVVGGRKQRKIILMSNNICILFMTLRVMCYLASGLT